MSKSNTIICAAKNCYSSLLTHPNKNFFGFPSDISLCKMWLENCGRTDLNLQQVIKRSYWRLCEDHFEDKWFTDISKQVLKRKLNPVPTIFVNNISTLLPSGTEAESVDVDCALNAVDLVCVELNEEREKPTADACDLREQQQLPISYDSKPLMQSVESNTDEARTNLPSDNPNTELLIVDQICRFCMSTVSHNYIDMFSNTDVAKGILNVSEIILQNKISVCDGLPHKVCHKCLVDLKTCQTMIGKFQSVDRYLRASAKYSLFMENEDSREISIESEEMEGEINYDDLIKTDRKDITILPLNKTVEESYQYLDGINIDPPTEVKKCKLAEKK